MLIKVKRKHIKKGLHHDSTSCALALAFEEAGLENVAVDYVGVIFEKDGVRYKARHSEETVKFVRGYDRMGGQGDPYEFEVNLEEDQ